MDHVSGIDAGMIDPNDLPAGFTMADPNAALQRTTTSTNNNNSAAATGTQQQQQLQQRQAILEQVMEPDALARLRRIQLVNSNRNIQMIENAIIQLATTNKLTERISDGKLIEMIERQTKQHSLRNQNTTTTDDTTTTTTMSSKTNSGIAIQRKKYAFDDDDEDDDNDDDLL